MNNQNAGSPRKTQGDQSYQLELALEFAPPTIREHGYRAAHSYPLVGIRREGGRFDSWRTDPPRAWPYPYIQLDAAHVFSTLKLDIDNPEATAAAEDRGAIAPYNVQTINPRTGHKHVCYMLATPVARHPEARPAPLKLLSRIAEYFTQRRGRSLPRPHTVLWHGGVRSKPGTHRRGERCAIRRLESEAAISWKPGGSVRFPSPHGPDYGPAGLEVTTLHRTLHPSRKGPPSLASSSSSTAPAPGSAPVGTP